MLLMPASPLLLRMLKCSVTVIFLDKLVCIDLTRSKMANNLRHSHFLHFVLAV